MKSERWRVRSLRRFTGNETIVYIYLGFGGLFSAIYFVAAVIQTHVYQFIFTPNMEPALRLMGHIVISAILRSIFWLPQLFWQVLFGPVAFMDWLLAARLLQGAS